MDIKEIEKKLKAPFAAKDIEWRVQSAGERDGKPWAKVLAYVTARAIMDRLDEVVGIDSWQDHYEAGPEGGVLCKLSVCISRDVADIWITKEDCAENTDIEAVKGGISGAIKRAAVKWGIGRYLYDLSEGWAVVSENGEHWQGAKEGKYKSFKWDPPQLPAWALPEGETPVPPEKPKAAAKTIKKVVVEPGKAPIVPEAGQTTPQAPTSIPVQSTTASGSALLTEEVKAGILKAFAPLKQDQAALEKRVALPMERWTIVQRNNLATYYHELVPTP